MGAECLVAIQCFAARWADGLGCFQALAAIAAELGAFLVLGVAMRADGLEDDRRSFNRDVFGWLDAIVVLDEVEDISGQGQLPDEADGR